MNLFVVWKMNTHIIYICILGYEHFCCLEDEHIYIRTRLYMLGYEPLCCGR